MPLKVALAKTGGPGCALTPAKPERLARDGRRHVRSTLSYACSVWTSGGFEGEEISNVRECRCVGADLMVRMRGFGEPNGVGLSNSVTVAEVPPKGKGPAVVLAERRCAGRVLCPKWKLEPQEAQVFAPVTLRRTFKVSPVACIAGFKTLRRHRGLLKGFPIPIRPCTFARLLLGQAADQQLSPREFAYVRAGFSPRYFSNSEPTGCTVVPFRQRDASQTHPRRI